MDTRDFAGYPRRRPAGARQAFLHVSLGSQTNGAATHGLQYINSDDVYVSDGRTRYQGVDLSGKLSLARNWTLVGGVMYLDAYNQQASAGVKGMRAYGTPRVQSNLYVEYAVPRIAGLVLDAGGRYVGNEAIDAGNTELAGSYHTFDLGARYTTRPGGHVLTWRACIDNLTNEKYWLANWGFILNQGTPRTVRASVTLALCNAVEHRHRGASIAAVMPAANECDSISRLSARCAQASPIAALAWMP
jgi:outer membrane receptor for ferric coprogen and ferric-rhodotorulic acid